MIQFFLGRTPAYHATGGITVPPARGDGLALRHPGAVVPPATAHGTGTTAPRGHSSDDLPRDRAGYYPPELERSRR